MKRRYFPDKNYSAIFNEKTGETLRFAIDRSKGIESLDYPEILDISLGNLCFGNCPYCYANSDIKGKNYKGIVEKIYRWFGPMDKNKRPFQVAIGGEGEPTLHPEFIDALVAFKELGIVPNFTTNGMFISNREVIATRLYCGGVAVSCHRHLELYWRRAIEKFTQERVRTNLHIIIGEPGSTDFFFELYRKYSGVIDTFVLLPYQPIGRAPVINVDPEFKELFSKLNRDPKPKVAFGALFYDFIYNNPDLVCNMDIELYEPEIMSGYVKFDREDLCVLKSSFDPVQKK